MHPGEFWELTPADFARMQAAYHIRYERELLPLRRIEAALWNVQIAKTPNGKQLDPEDLYALTVDKPRRKEKTVKPKTHYNAEEYAELLRKLNPPPEAYSSGLNVPHRV